MSLAVLAALAVVGMASPVEHKPNMHFSVHQVATGNTKIASPPIALLKAITKFNGTAPTVVKAAAAAAVQSGTVTATSYDVCNLVDVFDDVRLTILS